MPTQPLVSGDSGYSGKWKNCHGEESPLENLSPPWPRRSNLRPRHMLSGRLCKWQWKLFFGEIVQRAKQVSGQDQAVQELPFSTSSRFNHPVFLNRHAHSPHTSCPTLPLLQKKRHPMQGLP